MNKYLLLAVVFFSILPAFSQNKPLEVAVTTPAEPDSRLSDSLKANMLLVQKNVRGYYDQYNKFVEALNKQLTIENTKMEVYKDQAYKEAKLSPNDFNFDPETLTFVPKPKPPAKPEETK